MTSGWVSCSACGSTPPGFDVDGLLPAVMGALLVSVVSWMLTAFVSDRGQLERY